MMLFFWVWFLCYSASWVAGGPFGASFEEQLSSRDLGPWYNVFTQQQDHFDTK